MSGYEGYESGIDRQYSPELDDGQVCVYSVIFIFMQHITICRLVFLMFFHFFNMTTNLNYDEVVLNPGNPLFSRELQDSKRPEPIHPERLPLGYLWNHS